MRILVTFAVEAEFAPWRKRHAFRTIQQSGGSEAYVAEISGIETVVGLTGIGPEAASKKICDLTRSEAHELCITSGFAGALRSEHGPAQILAAREVLAAKGHSNALRGRLRSADRLLRIAETCGAKIVNAFYTSPTAIRSAAEKTRLGGMADAVEMESFEVMAEALAWLGEAIAVRVVSDAVDEDLPLDFNQVVDDSGGINMPRLAGQIAKNPASLPGLMRLGRRSSLAAKRLADFLDRYVAALAGKQQVVAPKEVSTT